MRDCKVAEASNQPEIMSSQAMCVSLNGGGIKAYAIIEALKIPGKICPVRRETYTCLKYISESGCNRGYVRGDSELMDLCLPH